MLYYEQKENDLIISVNSIKRGISRALKEAWPKCKVYVDPQEEDFERPSFSVHVASSAFDPAPGDITDMNLILQVVFYAEQDKYKDENDLDFKSILMYDCLRMIKPVSNDGLVSELPVHIYDIVFTKEIKRNNLVMTGTMLYKLQRISCPHPIIEEIEQKVKYARR